MQSVRVVVRSLIAAFLALVGPALAVPAVQAHAEQATSRSSGTDAASPRPLTISIDSVSPRYAGPTSMVTLSGTLSNHTGSAIPGIVVQVTTASVGIGTRSELDSFMAGGNGAVLNEPIPVTDALARPLRDGATTRWSISFPLQALNYYYSGFGVYPVIVQATSPASSHQATDHTLLPFWPGRGSATRLQVAWLWPLIDSPQQGACPQTLTTNNLASELAAGGRLYTLLHEGLSWAAKDDLTWAIDPALLSDVNVMTHPYIYGGNAICSPSGRVFEPKANPDAGPWLAALRTGTAGQPAFSTPYADVDAAALSHAGLDDNLTTAYRVGESVAGQILPGTFGTSSSGSGGGGALAAAWPADGTVDSGVLTSLAKDGGVRAVVLQSGSLPSATDNRDDALGLTKNDLGAAMPALLADKGVTSILGSANAGSSRADQFAAEQDFLAVTAMMVAEAPSDADTRSVVVAPPQRWGPSSQEAATLLWLTHYAPWLQSVGISKLATESQKLSPQRLPSRHVSHAELGGSYLNRIGNLNGDLSLFKEILYQPAQSLVQRLDSALLVTESTAWRGSALPGGKLALTKFDSYLEDNEKRVRLIAGKKILLAGTSGTTPISVQNGLGYRIRVKVEVWTPPGSQLSIGEFTSLLTIDPGKTATTRIPLSSTAIVTTLMQLQLVTTHESPLGTAHQMSVQVTRYGRTLLALIAGALGVLVLTSAARWYRRRRSAGRDDGSTDDGSTARAGAGGTG
jgi:hypothetical protein